MLKQFQAVLQTHLSLTDRKLRVGVCQLDLNLDQLQVFEFLATSGPPYQCWIGHATSLETGTAVAKGIEMWWGEQKKKTKQQIPCKLPFTLLAHPDGYALQPAWLTEGESREEVKTMWSHCQVKIYTLFDPIRFQPSHERQLLSFLRHVPPVAAAAAAAEERLLLVGCATREDASRWKKELLYQDVFEASSLCGKWWEISDQHVLFCWQFLAPVAATAAAD